MMTRRPWTDAELAKVRRRYPHERTRDLAASIQRSASSVYNAAHSMGLHKSAAFMASDASGRVQRGKQDPRMRATQFKPGMKPWNQGRKCGPGRGGNHPNARRTQFKKGEMSGAAQHNYVPVGSTRIVYGNLEVKLSDNPDIYPAARWAPLHRLVWELHNGPVPRGHLVVFRPGMHTTEPREITLDRIECITRSENMRRNTRHVRYPPEVNQIIQLKGALKRKINNRSKQS